MWPATERVDERSKVRVSQRSASITASGSVSLMKLHAGNAFKKKKLFFIFIANYPQKNPTQPVMDTQLTRAALTVNYTSAAGIATANVSYDMVVDLVNKLQPGLFREFPQIRKIYASCLVIGNNREHCVDICISDENLNDLPPFLNFTTHGGIEFKVRTRIIKNFKNAAPQAAIGGFIGNINTPAYLGTVCCTLLSATNPGNTYLLTCNHVMTGGSVENPGSTGDHAISSDGADIGTWQHGKMDNTMDAAIIAVDPATATTPNNTSLPVYIANSGDCSVTMVTIMGAVTPSAQAYIIHINQPMDVDYDDGNTLSIAGLITLSTTTNPGNFTPATQKGDSGALVCHSNTNQPIAMVIGANDQFTYAVPLAAVFAAFNDLQLSIDN